MWKKLLVVVVLIAVIGSAVVIAQAFAPPLLAPPVQQRDGQAEIYGFVFNAETGEPVSGVYLACGGSTGSKEDGSYVLRVNMVLPYGTRDTCGIYVSKPGYATEVFYPLEKLQDMVPIRFDIFMQPCEPASPTYSGPSVDC